MPARRFTDEQEREMAVSYKGGEGTVVLAQRFETTPNVIKAALNRQGLTRRTKDESRKFTTAPVDPTRFLGPDLSEAERYWIGFLMADGCITKTQQSKHLRLSVKLHAKDIGHLEKLRSFLSTTSNIFHYQDDCQIAVVSDEVCENLIQWGVVPRKSLIAKVHPSLDHDRDFWRGYIDGNGTVRMGKPKYKKSAPTISLVCGSDDLISGFLDFAEAITGFRTARRYVERSRSVCAGYGSSRAAVIVRRLYDGATVFLDRKRQAAEDVMAWKAASGMSWAETGRGVRDAG